MSYVRVLGYSMSGHKGIVCQGVGGSVYQKILDLWCIRHYNGPVVCQDIRHQYSEDMRPVISQ